MANCLEALREKIRVRYGEVTDIEIFAHMAEAERNGELGEMLSGAGRPARTWWQKVKRAFALVWQALRRMFGAPLKASDLGRMDWRDALHQMNEAMRTGQQIVIGAKGGVRAMADVARGLDASDGTEVESLVEFVRAVESGTEKDVNRRQQHWRLAKTIAPFKSVGLRGDFFTIRSGVITQHIGKDADHNLTAEDWVNVAESLKNPLVVAKYFTIDKETRAKIYNPRVYRIWTEAVINGHFALVGAFVRSPGRNIEVNAIRTVFGDKSVSIDKEDVLYDRGNGEGTQTLPNGTNPRQYSGSLSSEQSLPRESPDVNDENGASGMFFRAQKSGESAEGPRNLGSLDQLDHLAEGEPRRNGPVQFSRTLPEEGETPEEKAETEKKPTQGELPGVQWRPRSSKVSVLNGVVTYDDAELVDVGGWFTAKIARYQGRDGRIRWAVRGADGRTYVSGLKTEEDAKWALNQKRAEVAATTDMLRSARVPLGKVAEARGVSHCCTDTCQVRESRRKCLREGMKRVECFCQM